MPFDPTQHHFVLLPKINPQGIEHYELNNHAAVNGGHDFARMNVYLAKDGDFVNIWYGAVEAVCLQSFFEKHGVELESQDEKLFRGYIATKTEADVILTALRYDKISPSVYISEAGKLVCKPLS